MVSGVCRKCGDGLMYTARSRADGLCGPCHRHANGTQTVSDLSVRRHRWTDLIAVSVSMTPRAGSRARLVDYVHR